MWKPVVDYEDTYEISDAGVVRRLKGSTRAPAGFVLRQSKTKHGYLQVGLTRNGRQKTCNAVHRLVWEAHVGKIPEGMVINHLNGNKRDNRLVNLECVTNAENVRHAFRSLDRKRGGEKLDEKSVLVMRRAVAIGSSTLKDLARRFGVTEACVSSVVRGRTWRHVGGPITPSRYIKQSCADVRRRISDDEVLRIVLRYRNGEKVSDLAREYDVNKRTIYNWIEGRARAHLSH